MLANHFHKLLPGNTSSIVRDEYGTISEEVYGDYDHETWIGCRHGLIDLGEALGWDVHISTDSTCVTVSKQDSQAFCACPSSNDQIRNLGECIQFIQRIENYYPSDD